MIHREKHQHLRIRLASPEQIRSWAERILPNGEIVGQVTKPYTLHYKTIRCWIGPTPSFLLKSKHAWAIAGT